MPAATNWSREMLQTGKVQCYLGKIMSSRVFLKWCYCCCYTKTRKVAKQLPSCLTDYAHVCATIDAHEHCASRNVSLIWLTATAHDKWCPQTLLDPVSQTYILTQSLAQRPTLKPLHINMSHQLVTKLPPFLHKNALHTSSTVRADMKLIPASGCKPKS